MPPPFLQLVSQIESINEMFVEARDEIEYAAEEAGEHLAALLHCPGATAQLRPHMNQSYQTCPFSINP
jgi:hypothetical protein